MSDDAPTNGLGHDLLGHDLPAHVRENQRYWNQNAPAWVASGERNWTDTEPSWGIWGCPKRT